MIAGEVGDIQRFESAISSIALASYSGHQEVLKMLLQATSSKLEQIIGPLHMAALGGWKNCLETLIDHGWDLNQEDEVGWTVLQVAAYKGNVDLVQYFLKHPSASMSAEAVGEALCLAAEHGFCDVCRHIISHPACTHSACSHLKSAVSLACEHHYANMLVEMIGHLPDCASCMEELVTVALSRAADNPTGAAEVLQVLLENGASIKNYQCHLNTANGPCQVFSPPSLLSIALREVVADPKITEEDKMFWKRQTRLQASQCHQCHRCYYGPMQHRHQFVLTFSESEEPLLITSHFCSWACCQLFTSIETQ